MQKNTPSFQKALLKYTSKPNLSKFQATSIAIAGAGGIGSNIAILLTRLGFDRFEIVDHDVVEASNLNRQVYNLEDIGTKKVFALQKHLNLINPKISLKLHDNLWKADNAERFFDKCDILIDAFDCALTKQEIIQCYESKIPNIISCNGIGFPDTTYFNPIKKLRNIFFVGDNSTDTTLKSNPPLPQRVLFIASIIVEVVRCIVLDEALPFSTSNKPKN